MTSDASARPAAPPSAAAAADAATPAAAVTATVVYCGPDRQWLLPVRVRAGATLRDAIAASGLLEHVPALAQTALDIGVFNRPGLLDTPVSEGDRIEIYRPLTVDPKQARRVRAEVAIKRKRGAGR